MTDCTSYEAIRVPTGSDTVPSRAVAPPIGHILAAAGVDCNHFVIVEESPLELRHATR
jgi:hypothetical protein